MIALSLILAIVFSLVTISCSRPQRNGRSANTSGVVSEAININTANESELEKLPHIGETLARRIIEFREQNGPFRRPENLLLVDGISEKRFLEIRPLIKTE